MKKKIIYTTFALSCIFILIQSCSNQDKKIAVSANELEQQMEDSLADCAPTIKDPNNTKPMALMMRQMAANADTIKNMLLRGEVVDSLNFPFIRFYLVEPTDPNVLEPQFFENARLHQLAYKELFTHKTEQKKYYNLLINSCINCHQTYCSGPLKRIKKLIIS